jgi:hypothetical protein
LCRGSCRGCAKLGPSAEAWRPLLTCVMGHFVPWEIVWFLAHGKPAKAFARTLDHGGLSDAGDLKIQRPSVRKMARFFAPDFELRSWRGVGIAVPPSYMERWARRFPKVTKLLARADDWIDRRPLFRNMGDCLLLELSRQARPEGRLWCRRATASRSTTSITGLM